MVETLDLNELNKYAENIYEAIVIIAKRARQINIEQKQILERESEIFDEDEEDFDNEGVEKDLVDRKYIRLPKPTRIALDEYLAGKLRSKYLEDETQPNTDGDKKKK